MNRELAYQYITNPAIINKAGILKNFKNIFSLYERFSLLKLYSYYPYTSNPIKSIFISIRSDNWDLVWSDAIYIYNQDTLSVIEKGIIRKYIKFLSENTVRKDFEIQLLKVELMELKQKWSK